MDNFTAANYCLTDEEINSVHTNLSEDLLALATKLDLLHKIPALVSYLGYSQEEYLDQLRRGERDS